MELSRGGSMLTQPQIRRHYLTPEVRETILRVSSAGNLSRGGNGDRSIWYKSRSHEKLKINLSNRLDYVNLVSKCRSLYWTLNLFAQALFEMDYSNINTSISPDISREHTQGYTFGIDIDVEHGKDIHVPDVKKAVEDMAQYFTGKLREYTPNSVYVLYSGGGIYVLVHHAIFKQFFTPEFLPEYSKAAKLNAMFSAFNDLIAKMKKEFFTLHPEHEGKVKPDALNNSQRVFKTIFSIHMKHDYAVIPLDVENIVIDFDKATLPLKSEVLEAGKAWYTAFDDGASFCEALLMEHFKKAVVEENKTLQYKSKYIKSETEITNDKWPPCMKNLYELPECGEGATRALAVFVSFLGQVGIAEETARAMFYELVERWNARASNIFESYYGKMQTPTCNSLNGDPNIGFPHGVSLKRLCVCKPNQRCMAIPSPYYYADNKAEMTMLLSRLSGASDKAKGNIKKKPAAHSKKVEAKTSEISVETVDNYMKYIIGELKPVESFTEKEIRLKEEFNRAFS